jgi:hypothetical protein
MSDETKPQAAPSLADDAYTQIAATRQRTGLMLCSRAYYEKCAAALVIAAEVTEWAAQEFPYDHDYAQVPDIARMIIRDAEARLKTANERA